MFFDAVLYLIEQYMWFFVIALVLGVAVGWSAAANGAGQ